MIHDYDNPNTCYAIGDAVGQKLGTATANRQPASGVEEEISSIHKQNATDNITIFDGSDPWDIYTSGAANTAAADNSRNLSILITNTIYLRKEGTTDLVFVTGRQTNA